MKYLFAIFMLLFNSSLFADNSRNILEISPLQIVKSYFAYDIEEAKNLPTRIDLEIEIEEVDLNNDNVNEIIAIFQHPYFCGRAGCRTVILSKIPNNAWAPILSNALSQDGVEVLKEIHNGFNVITLYGSNKWIMANGVYEIE